MSEKLKIATNSHFLEKTSHMTSYIGHFRWAKTTISEKILIQISCPIFSDQYIPHPTIYLIRIFIINCNPLPLGSRNSICNFKQINFSEFSLDLIEVK